MREFQEKFDLTAGKKKIKNKKRKFAKIEKKLQKNKRKNSFRNKVNKMNKRTIKLINLYLNN